MYQIFEQLLRKYCVTAYEISKETGITQSTLSDWKRGKSTPKQDKLQKIANYFGVTVDYLMTGTDTPKTGESPAEIRAKQDLSIIFNQTLENFSNCSEPIYFNGRKLEKEELELFSNAVKNVMAIMDYKRK